MKVFIIDVGICNGCYSCQVACKDEHVGNDWSPYAKPQPDAGQFWLHLTEHIQGTVPKVKMHYVPMLCMHCDDAPCVRACPSGAIAKRDDGLVLIDPEKCTGSRLCVDACPYGAIYFNDGLNIAQKCTGCAHLLDSGEWRVPRCVDSCPTGALRFGEEEDFKDLIAGAEVLKPERGTRPRVYYLNIPGRFVAGTVYDPVEKEVVIGAACTLTGNDETRTGATDAFGDFWFRDLPDGKYQLAIEAAGFKKKLFDAVDVAGNSVNLGDIAMER
jgi:tetrathionate reductase subunit B